MTVLLEILVRPDNEGTDELKQVQAIAAKLHDHLNTDRALAAVALANSPGTSSAVVQAAFLPFALELGFVSEKSGLFRDYNSALRPDYYRPVGASGILMEVERGKTTANNMDLLDLWKCHICAKADYLFLLAPQALRHNPAMAPKREYASVVRRLNTFFQTGNVTNVRAAMIFGY